MVSGACQCLDCGKVLIDLLPMLWTPTLQLGSFWCWALALLASYCSFWEWKGSARHLIDQFLAYWITDAYIHTGTHTWIILFSEVFPVSSCVSSTETLQVQITTSSNCVQFFIHTVAMPTFFHIFFIFTFLLFLPHFCRQWWNIQSIYKNSWMHTKVRIRRQQWSISCHNEW